MKLQGNALATVAGAKSVASKAADIARTAAVAGPVPAVFADLLRLDVSDNSIWCAAAAKELADAVVAAPKLETCGRLSLSKLRRSVADGLSSVGDLRLEIADALILATLLNRQQPLTGGVGLTVELNSSPGLVFNHRASRTLGEALVRHAAGIEKFNGVPLRSVREPEDETLKLDELLEDGLTTLDGYVIGGLLRLSGQRVKHVTSTTVFENLVRLPVELLRGAKGAEKVSLASQVLGPAEMALIAQLTSRNDALTMLRLRPKKRGRLQPLMDEEEGQPQIGNLARIRATGELAFIERDTDAHDAFPFKLAEIGDVQYPQMSPHELAPYDPCEELRLAWRELGEKVAGGLCQRVELVEGEADEEAGVWRSPEDLAAAEAERLAALEAERLQSEALEAERLAAVEAERLEKERLEKERLEKERLEAENAKLPEQADETPKVEDAPTVEDASPEASEPTKEADASPPEASEQPKERDASRESEDDAEKNADANEGEEGGE